MGESLSPKAKCELEAGCGLGAPGWLLEDPHAICLPPRPLPQTWISPALSSASEMGGPHLSTEPSATPSYQSKMDFS